MSKWLNNTKRIYQAEEIEKPCHKCGFCPYGQLVEEFPLHLEAEEYAIKHDLYSYFKKGAGWVSCDKDHPGASPDLNKATLKVEDLYSCKVFGHDCPVFYHAEDMSE